MPIAKADLSRGFSLLEVMISVAILSLVIPLAYKVLESTSQQSASTEASLNLRSLARTIQNLVDCPKIPEVCTAQQLIPILQKDGSTLIAADGQTVLAGWRIRALCTGSNNFRIQVAKVDLEGNFVKDPATGQVLDWDAPPSTLFAEKTLCGSQAADALSQPPDLFDVKSGTSCLVQELSLLPCNPPLPEACDPGYSSLGLSIDTFGGDESPAVPPIFGQRWMRYCRKSNPIP